MNKRTNKRASTKEDLGYNQKGAYSGNRRGTKSGASTCGDNSLRNKFNDVSWYAKNTQLLRDAGSLSFNNPLGANMPYEDVIPVNGTFTANLGTKHFPGILRISFIPIAGRSVDNSSALNMAARNIYSFVRHANSGHANYDSPDLMLYLLAMDNIYMLYNHGKRVYGIARYYSQYNRYLPDGLITAMHFDKDDVINNLANLRYGLNQIAAKLNALAVPNTMSLFTRHSWMVSNVYKDADELKAQNYLWVPAGYFQYDETGDPRGGYLKSMNFGSVTVDQYLQLLNTALAAIIESEDMNIMSGDILKAYGVGKLWTISAIPEEYTVEPVYNMEVLNQMHNTTCFWSKYVNDGTTQSNITQDPNNGALLYNPMLTPFIGESATGPQAHLALPVIINMPRGEVSPEMVMVGTRATTQIELDSDASIATVRADSLGSELYTDFAIYTKDGDGGNTMTQFSSVIISSTSGTFYAGDLINISQLSHFDWHPLLYILGDSNSSFLGVIGDISNYTLVSANTLKKLHDTAILSELDVPVNGTV